jgi:hypothetical protein
VLRKEESKKNDGITERERGQLRRMKRTKQMKHAKRTIETIKRTKLCEKGFEEKE